MDQLDSVGVHDCEEGWVGQKWERILGVVAQQPLEARAFGQRRKPRPIIGGQPAVKAAKAPAFERKEQANRHNLTGIQMRVRSFVDKAQLVIYHAKQADDNLVRGHTVLLLMCSVHPHGRGRFCFAQGIAPAESTSTIGYYIVSCRRTARMRHRVVLLCSRSVEKHLGTLRIADCRLKFSPSNLQSTIVKAFRIHLLMDFQPRY
jgi:hypothetical protein